MCIIEDMPQFLRAFALLILILIAILDFKLLSVLLKKEWLYVLSVVILFILLFVDPIAGFILALAMITLIVKLYNIRLPWGYRTKEEEDVLNFVTPEHLRNAQTNIIIEEDAYEKDYKGIEGVYGEEVYGAQGLDVFPGYSQTAIDEL